jgi:transposase-like protein
MSNISCKRCEERNLVKHGFVRQKQRWHCKNCGLNFVLGDERKQENSHQKALACLLVCLGLSFRASGLVVSVTRNTVMNWFREFASTLRLPEIEKTEVDVVDFDEMHHFIQSKKTSFGSTKPPQRLLAVSLDCSMSRWILVALPD